MSNKEVVIHNLRTIIGSLVRLLGLILGGFGMALTRIADMIDGPCKGSTNVQSGKGTGN